MDSYAERGSVANGTAAPDRLEPVVDVERFECGGRHRVLGEDVERVGGDGERLDLAGDHPLDGDGAVHEVGAVFGEHDAAGDLPDLVSGAADPLQAVRHRRRRLDLDHQIDRAHVDSEFEAARRDHAAQPPRLQVVLDERPLVLADRTVVGAGEQRVRAEIDLGLASRSAPAGFGFSSTAVPARSA